ncbi:TPA: hypothetical protein PFD69_003546, partial [Vibrio cholerae]|nr:hypothetical protein [Vibrio cholerae]
EMSTEKIDGKLFKKYLGGVVGATQLVSGFYAFDGNAFTHIPERQMLKELESLRAEYKQVLSPTQELSGDKEFELSTVEVISASITIDFNNGVSILDSSNCSSLADEAVDRFSVNFSMPLSDYIAVVIGPSDLKTTIKNEKHQAGLFFNKPPKGIATVVFFEKTWSIE